jgi:hypothetical protein
MILIYSIQNSPRLTYTTEVIFRWVLKMKVPVVFTQEMDEFIQFQGRKINYSNLSVPDAVHVPCSEFLYMSGIKPVFPGIGHGAFGKALFPVEGSADFNFDVFAAIFYMVSRYEEYLPFEPDVHGRFKPEDSIAFKNSFLDKPIVHYWVEELKDRLMLRYPAYSFPKKKFRFTSTIDVDNVYAFLGKGFARMVGAMGKDLFKGNFETLLLRTQVVIGMRKDPFDEYKFHRKLKEKYGFPMRYFLLAGERSENDHNISPHHPRYKELIRKLKRFARICIHPSYQSHQSEDILSKEIKTLEKLTGKKILDSRQHFLKMRLPETYRQLLKAGIRRDYTMGYASKPGFRAGIAEPFPFYDLISEKRTRLVIRPFCIMETQYKDYMKIGPAEALPLMKKMVSEVKMVNGLLITVWHDRNFATLPGEVSWKDTYKRLIKYIH